MNALRFLPVALVLAACSDKGSAPTGSASRDPIHLVVSGTDREMGLQHGKALAKEIREEVGPRLKARFRAVAKDAKEAAFLEDACRVYTAKTRALLPAAVTEELAGISEGSGVPAEDILLLEVMRDGLRFHLDAPPLLEAAFASPPMSDPVVRVGGSHPFTTYAPSLVIAWDGPGGVEASGHALLLERRPVGRSASLVVTWPGGLGAFAGVTTWGVVGQAETITDKAAVSLAGVPFGIALVSALGATEQTSEGVVPMRIRNGNRVVAAAVRTGIREHALLARSGPSWDERLAPDHWMLAPAGIGGDARATAMDERLGGYPARPGSAEAIALAVSGRASQAGAVIEVRDDGITWHGSVDAAGKDLRPPIRFPFPSLSPK